MKLASIEVGREYAFAVGNAGIARAVVVDVANNYENWRGWNSVHGGTDPDARPVRRVGPSTTRKRILIAVARPVTGRLTADPDTDKLWADHGSRTWGISYFIDWLWIPYAARAADIRAPWDAEQHAPKYLQTYEEAVERGRDQNRQLAERDAENAVRAERSRVAAAERSRRLAVQQEFYDTRVEPALIEAGLDPGDFRFDGRGEADRVEINPEALVRMLDLLGGDR